MNYREVERLKEQELRYSRLVAIRRLRRISPWLFGAAMAVAIYWLVKLYLLIWG